MIKVNEAAADTSLTQQIALLSWPRRWMPSSKELVSNVLNLNSPANDNDDEMRKFEKYQALLIVKDNIKSRVVVVEHKQPIIARVKQKLQK
jgi:hypothetical protein